MSSPIECDLCGNFMDGSACMSKMIIGRSEYNRIPYGTELVIKGVREDTNLEDFCPGCKVHFNGFHHFPCEEEICPRCGHQLIHCGCGGITRNEFTKN